MSGQQIGVLHEIGDIGLGFDPLSDKDQQTLSESKKVKNQSGNDDSDEEGR